MVARQAVLLTPPGNGNCPLWSYPYTGTLPPPISFVSHSYENCRVCTNNSQSGTLRCALANRLSTNLGGGPSRFFRTAHSAFSVVSALNPSLSFDFQFSTLNFCLSSTYPLSFHTLANSFTLTKDSTLFFSSNSELFRKTPGGGGTPFCYHPASQPGRRHEL